MTTVETGLLRPASARISVVATTLKQNWLTTYGYGVRFTPKSGGAPQSRVVGASAVGSELLEATLVKVQTE